LTGDSEKYMLFNNSRLEVQEMEFLIIENRKRSPSCKEKGGDAYDSGSNSRLEGNAIERRGSMNRIILGLFIVIVLWCGVAQASLVFTLGNNPQPLEENILLNSGVTGTTVFG
jgi:hypothetical protein